MLSCYTPPNWPAFAWRVKNSLKFQGNFFKSNQKMSSENPKNGQNSMSPSVRKNFNHTNEQPQEMVSDNKAPKKSIDLGVKWDDIDFKRLFFVGTSFYFLEYLVIYPLDLCRTHIMTRKDSNSLNFFSGTFRVMNEVIQKRGIKGLYSGFWTQTVGR